MSILPFTTEDIYYLRDHPEEFARLLNEAIAGASGGEAVIADNAVTTAKINAKAVTAAKIADATITAAQIENKGVTFGKTKAFVSSVQTGTGAVQNIAHGLSAVPAAVMIVPYDTSATTAGDYVAVEGTHTTSNVLATVTTGKKYKVLAWA